MAKFESALKHEAAVRRERVAAWEAVEAQAKLVEMLSATQTDLSAAEESMLQIRERVMELDAALGRHNGKLEEAVNARSRHRKFKPGVVDALFSFGAAYREWRRRDLLLVERIEREEAEYGDIEIQLGIQEQLRSAVEERIEKLTADFTARKDEIAAKERALQPLRENLGSAFPRIDRWLSHPEERECSSPWADESWNRARTAVFVEALRLHRAFIKCVPTEIMRNLGCAMDILSGKVSSGADSAVVQSAWATLFFVVPVISTTFASFDRLFAHLGRESIGWLLIDEAGQAIPQAAAGALWRSKRAIVVGDPRQLEPIVTLPFTAQQALRIHFNVEETWLPSRNSVQTLTDRVSRFGTWLRSEGADEPIWVGSPLRVHRRCEKPMFEISNQIAYGRQMVYDTQERPSRLPPSCWIDVRAAESEGHWIPLEGLALEFLLQELSTSGIDPSHILLISPFREVAARLKEIGKWRGISQAGTVHVSQGKESEVVILVLGGDPRRPGAKAWAYEKPNLLNVAVSRAKRRLFIIGNREEWRQYSFFRDAAALMGQQEDSELQPPSGTALTRRTSGGK